jgi:hypothetical protein
MPMEPALKAMLVETVQHSPYIGQDAYGKPQYGPAVPRPARIEYRVVVAPTQGGQERTSTTQVFFDGDVVIGVRDHLLLPDGSAPAIQDVHRHMHDDAPARVHHSTVLL